MAKAKAAKGKAAKGKAEPIVEIKPLDIKHFYFDIEGTAPLIAHKFSEKAKKKMLDNMMGVATPKQKKNPEEEYLNAAYYLDNGKHGFPANAFKLAALRGGKAFGLVMTDLKGAFFVQGEWSDREGRELVEIKGTPEMREDTVTVGMGGTDLRYRPQYKNWRCTLHIKYNAGIITSDQIVNIFNAAGFGVGVGEWRPSSQSSGTFGTFQVAEQTAKQSGKAISGKANAPKRTKKANG